MTPGDLFIANIYEAIRSNQKVWKKTLFIITYDEAGGYYDGTPSSAKVLCPPFVKKGNWPPIENYDFDFSTLGVHVPGLLISEWFDHKIIISRFIFNRFVAIFLPGCNRIYRNR